MKKPLKISLIIICLFSTVCGFSQNWMMANKYMHTAIKDIIISPQEGSTSLIFYDYVDYDYNTETQMFRIHLIDTLPKEENDLQNELDKIISGDPDIFPTFTVNLHGGTVTSNKIEGYTFTATVPDFSDQIFILNETSNKITFSLSFNDTDFSDYALENGHFDSYTCKGGEYLYIKLVTLRNGKETGQIHYKLEKGKGYTVNGFCL